MRKREFILLFAGDDDSLGYATVGLASRICSEYNPATVQELRVLVFGSCPVEEIGKEELKMLEDGFNIWQRSQTTNERS